MKFVNIVLMLIMASVVLLPTVAAVGAPNINDLTGKVASVAGYDTSVTTNSVSRTIGQLIKGVIGFVGTIFLALTVYAGILWMTASGNDQQVDKALGIIKTAVIGFVITMSAYSIVTFVMLFSLPKPAGVVSTVARCDSLHQDFTAGGSDNGNTALDYNTFPGASGAGERIGKTIGCAAVTFGATILSPISWIWKTDWAGNNKQ